MPEATEASVLTKTIKDEFRLAGRGIHTGAECAVRFHPQAAGHGIVFSRNSRERATALWRCADASASDRRTVLVGEDGARFEQVEHLMAALAAEGITDALLEMEGPEVPFLGGGSKEYCEALRSAGIVETDQDVEDLVVTRPVTLQDGESILTATPHDGLRLSCFVEFPGTVVGNQGISLELSAETFLREAAPARTFALKYDIDRLREAGLIKGGNLENAVVFDEKQYYNETLHFEDEVVRHKVIDLLGDLALTGRRLRGHFWAWRAGHRSHIRFVHHLAKEFDL